MNYWIRYIFPGYLESFWGFFRKRFCWLVGHKKYSSFNYRFKPITYCKWCDYYNLFRDQTKA